MTENAFKMMLLFYIIPILWFRRAATHASVQDKEIAPNEEVHNLLRLDLLRSRLYNFPVKNSKDKVF